MFEVDTDYTLARMIEHGTRLTADATAAIEDRDNLVAVVDADRECVARLMADLARCREALCILAFYADPRFYVCSPSNNFRARIVTDRGDYARAALGGVVDLVDAETRMRLVQCGVLAHG